MRLALLAFVLLIGLPVPNLATSSFATPNNLSSAASQREPSIETYQDPGVILGPYTTFSVFPQSVLAPAGTTNELLEKQLLFALRNQLEARGYRFVSLDEHPDFLATIDASSKHSEVDMPPQNVQLPVWVPGTTVTSTGTVTNAWGLYQGTTTAITSVPGYMTTQTYTQPGHTTGFETPVVAVSVIDSRTLKRVWLGTGAGTSSNPDVRVSSQGILRALLLRFPNGPAQRPELNVALGMVWAVVTNNGNDYLPSVLSMTKGGPAAKAGLRLDDTIETIDGIDVHNKAFSEVSALLAGTAPRTPEVRLKVSRIGAGRSLFRGPEPANQRIDVMIRRNQGR